MACHITSYLLSLTLVSIATGLSFGSSMPLKEILHRKASTSTFSREVRSVTDSAPCLTIPFLTELKDRFSRWLDRNNDGRATFEEVKEYMKKFKPSIKDEAVTAFIRRRDMNGNGDIDFVPDYVRDMSAPDYTIDAATEWFHLQDTNDDNFVNEEELMNMTKALGMSPEDGLDAVRGYYMGADVSKDGQLSFDEFKTLYSQ